MNENTIQSTKKSFNQKDLLALVLACALSVIFIRLPVFGGGIIDSEHFFEKFAPLIGSFGLSLYWMVGLPELRPKKLLVIGLVFALLTVYVSLVPFEYQNDAHTLAFLHLPVFLWCLLGLVYMDSNFGNTEKRMEYLRFNGDMAVMSAILTLAGMALAAMTIGLFEVMDIQIVTFYSENVVVAGAVCIPIVAAFILRNRLFPSNKVAPLVAHLFSPLVLLTLIIFLSALPFSGKDPYNDRDFLLIFNFLLLGVMGLIVYGVSATTNGSRQRFNRIILFLLAVATLLIDGIALSAIAYRLAEFGFTPNRTAVLVSNVLIFVHLILITIALFKVVFLRKEIVSVERVIAVFLPAYLVWTAFVSFGFPWIF